MTTNAPAVSEELSVRFAPHRDTVRLTVSGGRENRGARTLSPFHKVEPRPWFLLTAENRGETAKVAELQVLDPPGQNDDAPRFAPDWAEWRLPPAPGEGGTPSGVDALSADCRVLHLLLLAGQSREIALELLPACRDARVGDYLFSVGGREIVPENAGAMGESLRPAVGCLELSYPEGALMALLPEVYREAARDLRRQTAGDIPAFAERFLLGFDEMEDALGSDIGVLPALFGVDSAPEEWLRWLATWVGLTLDDRWPEMRRRELIRHAIALYRRRGTVRGLSEYLELFTGVRPQISDRPVEGMRLGRTAVLGSPGTWLGNIAPHTFVVTLSPGRPALTESATSDAALPWDGVTVAALHDIIAASKPAHTAYELRILQDGATPLTVETVPDAADESPAAVEEEPTP